MKGCAKQYLFGTLSALLIFNVTNILTSFFIPFTHADEGAAIIGSPGQGVGSSVLGTTILGPNIVAQSQRSLGTLSGVSPNSLGTFSALSNTNTVFPCTSTSPTNQVQVTVSKTPFTNINVDPSLTNVLNTLPFPVTVTSASQSGTIFVTALNSQQICLNAGPFSITEGNPSISGFVFDVPTYNFLGPGTSGATTCNAPNAQVGQQFTCQITNRLLSNINGNTNLFLPTPGAQSTPGNIGTKTILTPQSSPGPTTTTPNPSADVTPTPRLFNPPFQICKANTVSGGGLTALPNVLNGADTTVTRAPSAAKYVIDGTVSLDKLRNALNSFGTDTFNIALIHDLRPDDGLFSAIASPSITGRIIVENDHGGRQKVINYNVENVRTECQYITLAQAFGPSPTANIAPLGQIGNLDRMQPVAPDIDKELVGGVFVSTSPPGTFPAVLNPIFATCQSGATGDRIADNFAIYNIKGDGSTSQIDGNRLTVEITADLLPADVDLAKIAKAGANDDNVNNPYIKATLIADPMKKSGHVIDFTLHDVTTDCKQISLATQSILKTLPGELDK